MNDQHSEFSTPVIPHKTKALIDHMIDVDGGAAFRKLSQKWLPLMGDAYRGVEFPFRNHFGFSGACDKCQRKPWLSWRWATRPQFPARLYRLFNRGHLEEGRFLAMLEMIGCTIWQSDPNTGKQFNASYLGGHLGGSGDGVAMGIPDLPPGTPFYCEFKTANTKNFTKFSKEGVRLSDEKYFGQCQQGMLAFGLTVTLFMMVCKETDDLYLELIPLYKGFAGVQRDAVIATVQSPTPPKGISSKRTFWACKMCNHFKVCKGDEQPERSCRSCKHAQPDFDDGKWYCSHPGRGVRAPLGTQEQQLTTGQNCSEYRCDWGDTL